MQEGKKTTAAAPQPPEASLTRQMALVGRLKTVTEIALCRVISKSGMEKEYGRVWRAKKLADNISTPLADNVFLMGLGVKPRPDLQILYWMFPMEFWDDCYFAVELPEAPILPAVGTDTQEAAVQMIIDLIEAL